MAKPPGYSWSPRAVEILQREFAAGSSASIIADKLPRDPRVGCPSRAAVCGKLFRMGLLRGHKHSVHRASTAPKQPNPRGLLRPPLNGHQPKLPPPLAFESTAGLEEFDKAIPLQQRLTFAALRSDTCRWPVGEPGQKDFFYCGGPVDGEGPYCLPHRRFASRS